MAFRLFSRNQVFFDNLGQPLAGGTVEFYDTGTTTPKDVYSDEDLAVNLGSTETLDSAGRFSTGIWGSGTYRVRFYDADDVEVADDDPIADPADAGLSIPSQTGHTGEVLTTDGVNLSWDTVSEVPDPTGQSGKVLTNDGTDLSWGTVPGLPTEGVEQDDDSITVGKMCFRRGTGTAPSSGTHTTSVAITFGVTYASAPDVYISPKENVITSSGFSPVAAVKSITTTGCTVHFDVNEAESTSAYNINTGIPFSYLAVGLLP